MYNGQVFKCPRTSVRAHGHNFSRTQTLTDIMDTKKDMRETDSYRRDTMSDINTQSPVAYKNRNEFSLLCLKRTERISAALYMVTGLIPDAEPLKWRLREKTLVLLTDMAIIRETLTADRMSVMNRARDTITELTTLLNVAFAGDLLSEMNVAVLKKEYMILNDILEEGRQMASSTERVVSDLFKEQYTMTSLNTTERATESVIRKAETLKGHIKDIESMSDRKMSDRKDVLYTKERPIMSFTKETNAHEEYTTHQPVIEKGIEKTKPIADIKNQRRNEIIAVIKKKKHVAIKDITLLVRNVGEKTIQREITAMVEEGVLKKQGSKRWSTYSLA